MPRTVHSQVREMPVAFHDITDVVLSLVETQHFREGYAICNPPPGCITFINEFEPREDGQPGLLTTDVPMHLRKFLHNFPDNLRPYRGVSYHAFGMTIDTFQQSETLLIGIANGMLVGNWEYCRNGWQSVILMTSSDYRAKTLDEGVRENARLYDQPIHNRQITFNTNRKEEVIDLTNVVAAHIRQSGIREGTAVVHDCHTTTGLLAAPRRAAEEVLDYLCTLVPERSYAHDDIVTRRKRDPTCPPDEPANAACHLRRLSLSPQLAIPIREGELQPVHPIHYLEFDGPVNQQRRHKSDGRAVAVYILPREVSEGLR